MLLSLEAYIGIGVAGHPFKAHVEYAPMQKIPKGRVRKDKYNGTIEKDKDYIAFLKTLEVGAHATSRSSARLATMARNSLKH